MLSPTPGALCEWLRFALYLTTRQTAIQQTLLSPSDWLTGLWGKHQLTGMAMLKESFLLSLPETIVLLPQAWTLTIELLMSLLLPLGLLLIRNGLVWLIFFSLFSTLFLDIPVFLLDFAFGLVIARYHQTIGCYFAEKSLQANAFFTLGIVLYTSGSIWLMLEMSETVIRLCTGIGAGLIIIYVLSSSFAQDMLKNSLLRQIGKVSYSAYLIHMLILLCMTPHILKIMEQFTTHFLTMWTGGYILTILIVQLLSIAMYYLLEVPSISLGRKLNTLVKSRI